MNRNGLSRMKKKLPERLAEVRAGRSQRQFARELGVFQQNVNRYENGTTPHTDFLIKLAVEEGVSLDWLLLGRGRMRRWPRRFRLVRAAPGRPPLGRRGGADDPRVVLPRVDATPLHHLRSEHLPALCPRVVGDGASPR